MFKLSALLLVLAAGVVNAAPSAPQPSGNLTQGLDDYRSGKSDGVVALASPGVYLCVNAQFVEPCEVITNVVHGACYALTGAFSNSLSSLGPDKGLKCYGYLNNDCTPTSPNLGPINYPGIDLPDQFLQDGVNYHDRINGIICWNS